MTRWNEQNDIANSIVVGDSLWDLLAARRGLWEWEFYPAGMGRMNLSAPEVIASTRIGTIC